MNVGIVVEGPGDAAAYPVLMRRIRNDIGELQVRQCGGKYRLQRVFLSFLNEFHLNHAWQINVAFVIRDSDCKPPQEIEEQLREVLYASGFRHFPVEFFATKCQLETWLLADENAVNEVSRKRGKNNRADAVPGQLESYKDAKKRFHQMLTIAGLPVTPAVYREIAQCVDIARIEERCPWFPQFILRVRGC